MTSLELVFLSELMNAKSWFRTLLNSDAYSWGRLFMLPVNEKTGKTSRSTEEQELEEANDRIYQTDLHLQ